MPGLHVQTETPGGSVRLVHDGNESDTYSETRTVGAKGREIGRRNSISGHESSSSDGEGDASPTRTRFGRASAFDHLRKLSLSTDPAYFGSTTDRTDAPLATKTDIFTRNRAARQRIVSIVEPEQFGSGSKPPPRPSSPACLTTAEKEKGPAVANESDPH